MIKERKIGGFAGLHTLTKIVENLIQDRDQENQEQFELAYSLQLRHQEDESVLHVFSKNFNDHNLLLCDLIMHRNNLSAFARSDFYLFDMYQINMPYSSHKVTRLRTTKRSNGTYKNHVVEQEITHFS